MTTRSTRQRRAIRTVFDKIHRPLGPQEVLDAVAQEVDGVGIATVYRNLKSLVEEGWLTPVELPGEPARFRCDACGSVFELEGCVGNFTVMTPPGFRVSKHEVILFGSCAGCVASGLTAASR